MKYSVALGCTLKLVILKFTGIAPLIVPVTVKVVDPTFTLFTVAVTCMLLDVLLAVTPMRVTEVVVVMVIVVYPFPKVAEPVPLVVEMVNVIGVVFVDGLTVAVVETGFPSGTNGVLPKVTVGLTLSLPVGLKVLMGHKRMLLPSSCPEVSELVVPTDIPLCNPYPSTVAIEVLAVLQLFENEPVTSSMAPPLHQLGALTV